MKSIEQPEQLVSAKTGVVFIGALSLVLLQDCESGLDEFGWDPMVDDYLEPRMGKYFAALCRFKFSMFSGTFRVPGIQVNAA